MKKRIPKKHQWCYERCQNTKAQTLYYSVLEDCLSIGNAEYFGYIYEKYWKKIAKRQNPEDGRDSIETGIFCCAIAGDFSEMEADLRKAEETINLTRKSNNELGKNRTLYTEKKMTVIGTASHYDPEYKC